MSDSPLYVRRNAIVPIVALLALTGKEGYFYKLDADGKAVAIAAATDIPDGLIGAVPVAKEGLEISALKQGGNHGPVLVKLGAAVTDLRKDLVLRADGSVEPDDGTGARVIVARPLQLGAVDEQIEAVLVPAKVFGAAVAAVATADGSDAGTTQTLANALKVKLNALIASLNASGFAALLLLAIIVAALALTGSAIASDHGDHSTPVSAQVSPIVGDQAPAAAQPDSGKQAQQKHSGVLLLLFSCGLIGMVAGIEYDAQLTSFAHGIAPDLSKPLADLMAPQCVAPAGFGHYVKFDDDEAFRWADMRRARGGDIAMIEMPANSGKFSCDPYALGIPIDVDEKRAVGDAGMGQLRESKTRTLMSREAVSREKRVFDAYALNTTALDGLGVWTNAAKDPIDELDGMISDLATQTGSSDINLVVSLSALRQIRKHPKVRALFPGAATVNVSAQVLASLLIMPVNLKIASMPIAMEKTGKAASKVLIGAGKIYAFISQPNPSPFDPSAFKTFTTTQGQVRGIASFQKPPFVEVLFMDYSEEILLTGTQCVSRIDVTTGAIG